MTCDLIDDISSVAAFLAASQIDNIGGLKFVDCIVLCGSALLPPAETIFAALEALPA